MILPLPDSERLVVAGRFASHVVEVDGVELTTRLLGRRLTATLYRVAETERIGHERVCDTSARGRPVRARLRRRFVAHARRRLLAHAERICPATAIL